MTTTVLLSMLSVRLSGIILSVLCLCVSCVVLCVAFIVVTIKLQTTKVVGSNRIKADGRKITVYSSKIARMSEYAIA